MPALDTNLLVRFLVQDDAVQGAAATRLIQGAVLSGGTLFVPVTVLLALEWVLRSAFGFDKPTVMQANPVAHRLRTARRPGRGRGAASKRHTRPAADRRSWPFLRLRQPPAPPACATRVRASR